MAEKKKNKNLLYLLLGLGVVGGLYFITKKKGETVDEVEKPTSDVGNDKNDKPEIKKDDLGQPKVQPSLPSDFVINTGVVKPKEPTVETTQTKELLSGREVDIKTSTGGRKSSPIVETVDFTL